VTSLDHIGQPETVYKMDKLLRLGVTSVVIEGVTRLFFPSTFRAFEDCISLAARDGRFKTEVGAALTPWDSAGTGGA
jgi:hypothetical protein